MIVYLYATGASMGPGTGGPEGGGLILKNIPRDCLPVCYRGKHVHVPNPMNIYKEYALQLILFQEKMNFFKYHKNNWIFKIKYEK